MPEISELLAKPAPERFDGAEAWSKLSPEAQILIGSIALELPLVWHLQDLEGSGPESKLSPLLARVTNAADRVLMDALETAVCEALPPGAYTAPDGATRIPAFIGGVCRICGCSQFDACDGGCGWAAEDLCTACTEDAPSPQAELRGPDRLSGIEAETVASSEPEDKPPATEPAFPYPDLPKWVQMCVAGPSVTPEQASEIIRRTDTFFCRGYGGNDKNWNVHVKQLVGMPLGFDGPISENMDDRELYAAEEAWREAWGCLETEYVHNSWVSCAFLGGPHGWCSPIGTIYFRDNVGKWPSCGDIERDWRKLAEAFPFVDCEVLLMSGESCEIVSPVCGFIVKDGTVTPKLPRDHDFHRGVYAWSNIGPSMEQQVMSLATPARFREVGVSEVLIRRWAEHAKHFGALAREAESDLPAPGAMTQEDRGRS